MPADRNDEVVNYAGSNREQIMLRKTLAERDKRRTPEQLCRHFRPGPKHKEFIDVELEARCDVLSCRYVDRLSIDG